MSRTRQNSRAGANGRTPKKRRTFTLSQESIALLKELSWARRGSRRRSVSAVLDDLLRALDKQRKRESVEQAVVSYYDSLSEKSRAEERKWGEFSLAQFIEQD